MNTRTGGRECAYCFKDGPAVICSDPHGSVGKANSNQHISEEHEWCGILCVLAKTRGPNPVDALEPT